MLAKTKGARDFIFRNDYWEAWLMLHKRMNVSLINSFESYFIMYFHRHKGVVITSLFVRFICTEPLFDEGPRPARSKSNHTLVWMRFHTYYHLSNLLKHTVSCISGFVHDRCGFSFKQTLSTRGGLHASSQFECRWTWHILAHGMSVLISLPSCRTETQAHLHKGIAISKV